MSQLALPADLGSIENLRKLYEQNQLKVKSEYAQQRSLPGSENFIQHAVLSQIYHRYVTKTGWFNYRAFQRDKSSQQQLKDYIEDLALLNPDGLEDSRDRLASWLNLYNAIVIAAVMEDYPVRQVTQIKDFFAKVRVAVGEERYSILDLEQKIFAEKLAEPRAVFGRVNGGSSGPRLFREAFQPLKLKEQLDDCVWRFILDRRNLNYDARRRMLSLSPVFSWNQREIPDLPGFLQHYLDRLPPGYQIEFVGYDWKLNDEKLH